MEQGDTAQALALAEQALHEATEVGANLLAIPAALTLSACLRASGADAERIAAVLGRAESLIRETGAVAFETRLEKARRVG